MQNFCISTFIFRNISFSKRSTEGSEAEKQVRISDDSVDINKKTIEKLLRTNSQIISKLELNNNNKNNNNTIDPEYVKELVKKVSKILFENFVYPSQDEYKLATKKYLKDENPEFMSQFKKNQWIIFFEKKIALAYNNIEAYEGRSRLELKTLYILFSKRLGINYRLLTLRLVRQKFRNGRRMQLAYVKRT
ncbi:hypothetical protein GLOIN_2v1482020 [Rhizophagus irregularis DAOM 181602=DAOM 197198]|nr:hypothetical protein GLOIN_2v1482020 [Rhizophagus irregularis DAOM 181602=DAOM 197198]